MDIGLFIFRNGLRPKNAIIICVLAILSCKIYSQNCVSVNHSNIEDINNIIESVSLQGGGCVIIEQGEYRKFPFIKLKSNIVLIIHGDLYRGHGVIGIHNCENVKILGEGIGKIEYSNRSLSDVSKGVIISKSTNIDVSGLKIEGFSDKGILVRGPNTKNISIIDNVVSGAVGTHGVGIGVSDDLGDVSYCKIEHNTVFNNRIGISVNKSKFIEIKENHSYSNTLHGIGLDGLITLSGDGAKNCLVSKNVVYNNGGVCKSGRTKSGIYLGNGSELNLVIGNIVWNNRCHGIFYYEELNNVYRASNNTFVQNQIVNNEKWGIRLVNSKRTKISHNYIKLNGEGDIKLENSTSEIIRSEF